MIMNNKNFKKFLNLYTRFIFILFACLCTVQAAPLHSNPKEFYQNRSQADIELVLTSGPAVKTDFVASHTARSTNSTAHRFYIDFSLSPYFALREYNQFILHYLKLIPNIAPPHADFIAALQRKSIWHQSSDEDPLS